MHRFCAPLVRKSDYLLYNILFLASKFYRFCGLRAAERERRDQLLSRAEGCDFLIIPINGCEINFKRVVY